MSDTAIISKNVDLWQRANGRAAMILFWGLVSAYTYFKYFT